MSKTQKVFDRSVAFTFYKEWKQDADTIEEDFGAEVKAAYYDAIINYALFEIEPEMKAPIKYFWNSIKEKIDASQGHRSRSFREDTELTNKIIDYRAANPTASQRNIAEAIGCSTGKVNKVLNTDTSTNTNTSTSTSTSTNTGVNVNVNAHEEEKEEKREIEDLSEKELQSIKQDYKGHMSYNDIKQKYNLKAITKEQLENIDALLRAKQQERQKAERAKNDALYAEHKSIIDYIGGTSIAALNRCLDYVGLDITTFTAFADKHEEYSFDSYAEKNSDFGFHKDCSGNIVCNVQYQDYLKKGINASCA